MDGWIKWLGELVWRIAKLPDGIRGDKGDENFYFRLYGILSLLVSLAVGMVVIRAKVAPLSQLLLLLNDYGGGDKVLAQGYFVAGLILILAVPIVFAATIALATVVSILPALALRWSKLAAWASYQWAKRFKAKQANPTKGLSPHERTLLLFLLLLAGLIIWIGLKTGAKPDGEGPAEPATPPEPATDDKDNAAPPAA